MANRSKWLAVAVVVLLLAGGAGYYFGTIQLQKGFDAYLKRIHETRPGTKITYKTMSTNPLRWSVSLHDVMVTSDPGVMLGIRELTFQKCDLNNEVPDHCDTYLKGVGVSGANPAMGAVLTQVTQAFGEPMALDAEVHHDYRVKDDFKYAGSVKVEQPGKAKLTGNMNMQGLDLAAMRKSLEDLKKANAAGGGNSLGMALALMGQLSALKISSFKLELEGVKLLTSLVDQMLVTMLPKERKSFLNAAELGNAENRKKALELIEKGASKEKDKKFVQIKNVKDFLVDPKSVRLSLQPERAKPISEVISQYFASKSTNQLTASLGLKFELNDQLVDFF